MPANAGINTENSAYYTASYGIELASSSSIANPMVNPPVLAPTPSSAVSSQLGFTGQWSTFALDSGVIAIHSVMTTDNYVLMMERPGNREQPVRSSHQQLCLPALRGS